jgi:hypothetical protein
MSVGLGGDGEEIVAIDDVESAFGVKLDKGDASQWHTAGDVFVSLCKALSADTRDEAPWSRFTEILAGQTGVDPEIIERDSPLLLHRDFGSMLQKRRQRSGLPQP